MLKPARSLRRAPKRSLVLTAALTVCAGVLAATPASAAPPIPDSIASLGDSITRGFNACGWFSDCTSRSWSTGDSTNVNTHRVRLLAQNSGLTQNNDARSGAKIADLNGQAQTAVSQGAEYVTILMGANDACASSESAMTSVADFESRFSTAMQTLRSGLPDSSIFVASIPDIKRLWQVGKDNGTARGRWSLFGICKAMLANPTSTDPADESRRDRVRQRVIDFNAVLERVCSAEPTCKYDGGAVFSYPFELSQVSGWDYFHPNEAGQRVLAEETWKAGFWPGSLAKSSKRAKAGSDR